MLWILALGPLTVCDQRREVAREMLAYAEAGDMYEGALLIRPCGSTRKIACLFREDLESVATSGLCPQRLWDFMMDLSSIWKTNTQFIEGVNGTIKKQKKVAPHMSFPLMSARTTFFFVTPSAVKSSKHRPAGAAHKAWNS